MLDSYIPGDDRGRPSADDWLDQIMNNPFWGASKGPVNFAKPGETQQTYINPWDHPQGIFYQGGSQFGSGSGAGSPGAATGSGVGPYGTGTSAGTAAGAAGGSTLAKALQTALPFLPFLGGAIAGGLGGSSSGLNAVEDEIRKLLALQVSRMEQAQPTYDAMLALANAMAPNPQNWR